jgi:TRAP-type C4-dicarboxylate transport system permease small subunit
MIRNRKAGVVAVVTGLAIIAIGMISYIVIHSVFLGTTGNNTTGLFGIAENNLNISASDPTYQVVKNTWTYVPLGLIFAGLLFIIINSQRREFDEFVSVPRRR